MKAFAPLGRFRSPGSEMEFHGIEYGWIRRSMSSGRGSRCHAGHESIAIIAVRM